MSVHFRNLLYEISCRLAVLYSNAREGFLTCLLFFAACLFWNGWIRFEKRSRKKYFYSSVFYPQNEMALIQNTQPLNWVVENLHWNIKIHHVSLFTTVKMIVDKIIVYIFFFKILFQPYLCTGFWGFQPGLNCLLWKIIFILSLLLKIIVRYTEFHT